MPLLLLLRAAGREGQNRADDAGSNSPQAGLHFTANLATFRAIHTNNQHGGEPGHKTLVSYFLLKNNNKKIGSLVLA